MTIDEIAFRLTVEAGLIVAAFLILSSFASALIALVYGILIAHTINWSLNGNFWATQKFFGKKQNREVLAKFLMELKDKISRYADSIVAVAAFGSLSRRRFSGTSDLDIRIVRESGIINWVKANSFAFRLRAKAFISAIPLDLFVLDRLEQVYTHISVDEEPVVIYDPHKSLLKVASTTHSLEQFLSETVPDRPSPDDSVQSN